MPRTLYGLPKCKKGEWQFFGRGTADCNATGRGSGSRLLSSPASPGLPGHRILLVIGHVTKVEMHDKIAPLRLLGLELGMFGQKVEHTGRRLPSRVA